jgi:hypothetical protein
MISHNTRIYPLTRRFVIPRYASERLIRRHSRQPSRRNRGAVACYTCYTGTGDKIHWHRHHRQTSSPPPSASPPEPHPRTSPKGIRRNDPTSGPTGVAALTRRGSALARLDCDELHASGSSKAAVTAATTTLASFKVTCPLVLVLTCPPTVPFLSSRVLECSSTLRSPALRAERAR